MLRLTFASLLLGALGMVAGLYLFFAPKPTGGAAATPILFSANPGRARLGSAEVKDETVLLTLGRGGLGAVNLTRGVVHADRHPYLHIALDAPLNHPDLVLAWLSLADRKRHTHKLENGVRDSLWIATAELEGWSGRLSEIDLAMRGSAGDTIAVRDFSLYPYSLSRQLAALYSDWISYMPWRQSSVNSLSGATKLSSFYPVPLAVGFLACSLLACDLLVALSRRRSGRNWQAIALIFLFCWVVLDVTWQTQLLRQLGETRQDFAGLGNEEKLLRGPDGKLYGFIAAARQQIEEPAARVIVSARDDYRGLRSAYYLYPHNVYWELRGPTLPPDTDLRSGDYLIVLKPTELRYNPDKRQLWMPRRLPLPAERLMQDSSGMLLRLL